MTRQLDQSILKTAGVGDSYQCSQYAVILSYQKYYQHITAQSQLCFYVYG